MIKFEYKHDLQVFSWWMDKNYEVLVIFKFWPKSHTRTLAENMKIDYFWSFSSFTVKLWNNKKRSHTQLDSRKQVIAFQDRVMTINIKETQHPLKWEKQVIDKSSIMLKISTRSMHRVLVWEIGPANNTTRCSRLSKHRLLHAWHPSELAINLSIDKSKWQIHVNNKSD